MANIIQYLQDILSARYGKDVRQSIHDAIEEINNVNEANIGTVQAIADTAQGYADTALQAKTDAQTAQTGAETAQTNAETAEDGAEHFYNETVAIAQTLSNAIIARGTIAFADLPDVSSTAVKDGFMWNISDNFTTTSDFVEGAGVNIPMGANVYKITINNVPKWDILAGSSAAVFVGTEAQIAQAEAQGLISENTMIISLDGEMPYELTSSMILHGSVSVENKLDDVDDSIAQINSDLSNLFTSFAILFNGSIQGGSDITLSDNINKYRMISIIDGNTDSEATQMFNTYYGSTSSYGAIIASIVDYNGTAGVMILADIALTSSDGTHYHCERSAQWNFDGNGIAYFSTNQSANIIIKGYV